MKEVLRRIVVCVCFLGSMYSQISSATPATNWIVQLGISELGGAIYSSPALGPDGSIYVGSGRDGDVLPSYTLFSISPQGTLNWRFNTGGSVQASPAIASDGTIYIGSADRRLYSVSPSGSTNWAVNLGGQVFSSPALGVDGTIYVGAIWNHFNYLFSLRPDGTTNWIFNLGDVPFGGINSAQFGSPSIGPDGAIYVGSLNSNVYSISPQGQTNWMFAMTNKTYCSPAIANDGTIYIGSDDGNLYAIDRSGNRKWNFKTGYNVESSPAVAADGTVYIGGLDGIFHAFDADGNPKWSQAPGGISASPAICADGSVLVASYVSGLYAYSSSGAILWSLPIPTGQMFSSPVVASDGTIYVTVGTKLYSLQGTNAPENGPWFMFRRDAKHNARSIQRGLSLPSVVSGGVSLTMNTETDRVYSVQFSTNLQSWQELTNFTPVDSPTTVIDSSGAPARFYRLRTTQ
jgi:outer membrane protein assembly factor BamB